MKKYRDFVSDEEYTYITPEILAHAKCSLPTLIKWIQEWVVDGKKIGFKRGGRWVIHAPRLNKFLRGYGKRVSEKPRKPRRRVSKSDKTDCIHYPDCLETASRYNLERVCDSDCPDYTK